MNPAFEKFIDQYSHGAKTERLVEQGIADHLSVLELTKNHILLRENQHHDFSYFVLRGAVRSYYLKDGVEVNTWFAFENEMVGSLRNYRDLPSRETFALVEDSTLIAINMRSLKPHIRTNLHIGNFVSNIIEEYALFLEDRIYFSQGLSSMERYIFLMEREPRVLQRIPLTYIASYLGISRETLSRLRSK
jgi:CRP-like cAMP-binding protein